MVGVALAFAFGVGAASANDSELRRQLSGTWEGTVVVGDIANPGDVRYSLREIVITPENITAHDSDGRFLGVGTYKLSQAGGQLTIDAIGIEGPARGQTMLGIYEISGDTLHWCTGNNGKPRPGAFRTQTPESYLLVLNRRKS